MQSGLMWPSGVVPSHCRGPVKMQAGVWEDQMGPEGVSRQLQGNEDSRLQVAWSSSKELFPQGELGYPPPRLCFIVVRAGADHP